MSQQPSITPDPDLSDLSDEEFVHHCYVEEFGRPCNMDEAAHALAQLASGQSRVVVCQVIRAMGFRQKSEPTTALRFRIEMLLRRHDGDFVRGAYLLILGRKVDHDGFETYLAAMRNGTSKQEILKNLVQSKEAKVLPGVGAVENALFMMTEPNGDAARVPLSVSDLLKLTELEAAPFLEHAYRIILGREIDPIGRDHYAKRLAGGYSRQRIIADISLSREARNRPRSLAATVMIRMLHRL